MALDGNRSVFRASALDRKKELGVSFLTTSSSFLCG